LKLLDGTLEEFEKEETDKFQSYVERLENQELEEGESNPVVYDDSPFFICELTSLSRISFAVADDPFYKSERSKYYPECVVISPKGKILTKINPFHTSSEKYGLDYMDDIREAKMTLNDDKKVRISLSTLAKKDRMVLLTVKTYDMRMKPPKEGEFDRAWFRLNNEETNQTIDYFKIKGIEKPDGFEEDPPLEEGVDINEQPRNEIVYIVGRLFYDESGRWVYENFNMCLTTDKFENPVKLLAELFERSESERNFQDKAIKEAKDKMEALEEERRQMAAAKAAAAKKKKNKKDAQEEDEKKQDDQKAPEPV